MARSTEPTSYQDICALSPQDYGRFQEAAKARAHALRQEAIAQFWSDFGRWAARRFSAPLAQHKGRSVKPSLA